MAGSWDPDDSPYGTKGGRIYGTALATLTLEVYYRFLRLYEPTPTLARSPRPRPTARTRRAGFGHGAGGTLIVPSPATGRVWIRNPSGRTIGDDDRIG